MSCKALNMHTLKQHKRSRRTSPPVVKSATLYVLMPLMSTVDQSILGMPILRTTESAKCCKELGPMFELQRALECGHDSPIGNIHQTKRP